MPGLVRDYKRDGRSICDQTAKRKPFRRYQQPGVSEAAMVLAYRLTANVLRKWITMAAGRRSSPQGARAVLLPARIERPESIAVPAPVPADGYVEIVLTPRRCGWPLMVCRSVHDLGAGEDAGVAGRRRHGHAPRHVRAGGAR